MTDANLSGANLPVANLTGTILVNANLSNATLFDATLSGANMFNANLSGANLVHANIPNAILTNANFSESKISLIFIVKDVPILELLWRTFQKEKRYDFKHGKKISDGLNNVQEITIAKIVVTNLSDFCIRKRNVFEI